VAGHIPTGQSWAGAPAVKLGKAKRAWPKERPQRGTYWRVLCPDGRQGWLHKMTLGDVVIESGAAATGSWTSGDEGPVTGGFEDMLRAYTERRQQFGEAS
jgi:hypothetical protein